MGPALQKVSCLDFCKKISSNGAQQEARIGKVFVAGLAAAAREQWGCRLEHEAGRFQLIRLRDRQPQSIVPERSLDDSLDSSRKLSS